jgi:hypothetical protein
MHGNNSSRVAYDTMRDSTIGMNDHVLFSSLTMPSLPADLFPDMTNPQNQNSQTNRNTRANNRRQSQTNPVVPPRGQISLPSNNPWLDDDMPISPVQESRIGTIDNPEYFNRNQNPGGNSETQYRQFQDNEPGEYPLYDLEIPSYNPMLD